jgi:hypothetical protein
MAKIPITKKKELATGAKLCFEHWRFEILTLFGICILGFGI